MPSRQGNTRVEEPQKRLSAFKVKRKGDEDEDVLLRYCSLSPSYSQTEPISESPCSMTCRYPGINIAECGNDIHAWHDGLNMCTNYGQVTRQDGMGVDMVVGSGSCNIAWSDGTRVLMTCAYGNCEGTGKMRCGGVLYDLHMSCYGGPRGDQSDASRMDFQQGLATCHGFGNGMEARCENGNYTFLVWD